MIRPFRIGDEPFLWDVFHSAVHTSTVDDYTLEQRLAWAPDARDAEARQRWTERMRAIRPFVMERDGATVGYADLQPDGTIDHFFVAGAHAGTGVGSALMHHLLAEARSTGLDALTSHVSLSAQPFFARYGFVVVAHRTPMIRGVVLPNAAMRRDVD